MFNTTVVNYTLTEEGLKKIEDDKEKEMSIFMRQFKVPMNINGRKITREELIMLLGVE